MADTWIWPYWLRECCPVFKEQAAFVMCVGLHDVDAKRGRPDTEPVAVLCRVMCSTSGSQTAWKPSATSPSLRCCPFVGSPGSAKIGWLTAPAESAIAGDLGT